ncbi:MAG: TIGR02206 family membrane protein [Saprospiraceae bacterium]
MNENHFIITSDSPLWWYGFAGFLGLGMLVFYLGLYFQNKNKEPEYRRILFYFLLAREIIHYIYLISNDKFSFADSLPLHLCGLSYLAALVFLYKPQAFIFEFLLLLSIGGALQSILTPEMTHGYSPYLFLDYYISHSAIIITPLYAFFVLKMKLREKSWFYIWIAAHIVLGTVGIINWFLHSNYIYLCIPPKVDNPMVTGGYPYHLIGFEIFGSLHILILYTIFKKLIKAQKVSNAFSITSY